MVISWAYIRGQKLKKVGWGAKKYIPKMALKSECHLSIFQFWSPYVDYSCPNLALLHPVHRATKPELVGSATVVSQA